MYSASFSIFENDTDLALNFKLDLIGAFVEKHLLLLAFYFLIAKSLSFLFFCCDDLLFFIKW